MQLVDFILQITFYGCITAVVTAYLLYDRLRKPDRSMIRVHFGGGTEKAFDAVEIGKEVIWIQDGEEMRANIPRYVAPGHTSRWGVHYRVYDIGDGDDEVTLVPWLIPTRPVLDEDGQIILDKHGKPIIAEYTPTDDPAEKERYRRRTRAANSFKQIAQGLGHINRWQAAALIILGLFAGLYLAPILERIIT